MRGILGAVLILSLTGFVEAAVTRLVPEEYPTIQAAVDGAQSGDTVSIKQGTYTENISAGTNVPAPAPGFTLTIAGRDKPQKTIVNGTILVHYLGTNRAKVTIRSLTVKSATPGESFGMNYISGDGDVADCIIEQHKVGVYAQVNSVITSGKLLIRDNRVGVLLGSGSNKVTVSNSVVVNNQELGLWVTGTSIGPVQELTVRDSLIAWNGRGDSTPWGNFTRRGLQADGSQSGNPIVRLRNTVFQTNETSHLCVPTNSLVDEGGNLYRNPNNSTCQ